MALGRRFNLLILRELTRHNPTNIIQCYASIPPSYTQPIYKKDEQQELYKSESYKELAHVRIKPATNSETSSEFHDQLVSKFTNYIMRNGNKLLARSLLARTFEHIKMIQLERYNKASPEEKEQIELNPKLIFFRAIENCKPILGLKNIKKGGITYQVPIPLSEHKSSFLSMNWLIKTSKEKDATQHFPEVLAKEIIDAADNKGRIVKKKHDLHKQCEANRAYAHFRWT
ncbi:28S ribosomal protein S7, mitochondrial [Colletes gigas]|uniref:28S ribosomal protein S7, mitochondrial n=1 Tax=Colletes gigas TaxID=935657 RepID=UPI001C9B6F5B|nr:28S ribosomal protein S7, mitochondrial [Colletes gigas]